MEHGLGLTTILTTCGAINILHRSRINISQVARSNIGYRQVSNQIGMLGLLFVLVMIVNTYQRTSEGKYLAKSY